MKIIQIDDEYIDELNEAFPHVMFSKKFKRKHTRKYFGIVLQIDDFNYYVPLSSPKASDYKADGEIKKDTLFDIYITEPDGLGNKKLLGKLKLNNMIPVPLLYVQGYSIENEIDSNYANLVLSELKWINKNQEYIVDKAKKIYNFKANETKYANPNNQKRYDYVLPFKAIEEYIREKNIK